MTSALDLYSPFIIESMIHNLEFKALFPDFLKINCPKFSEFRSIQKNVSENGPCHGKGFDLAMQLVHKYVLLLL